MMKASYYAVVAILLWASLATLAQKLSHIPPFFLVGAMMVIGSIPSLRQTKLWFESPTQLAFGSFALFSYHALLFLALRRAPAVEANLVNYLWPLLIVLLSPLLLKGFRLHLFHILGAALAFSGATIAITGGRFSFDLNYAAGYTMAFAAALIWAVYSLLSSRMKVASSAQVGGFCFFAGVTSLIVSFFTEHIATLTFVPLDFILIFIAGIGPLGLAFYAWDASLKRGDPRQIAALSYFTPLLSTFSLMIWNDTQSFSPTSLLALVLIFSGSILSSLAKFKVAPKLT